MYADILLYETKFGLMGYIGRLVGGESRWSQARGFRMVSMIVVMHSVRYPIRLEDSRTQGRSFFAFLVRDQVLSRPIL